MADEHESDMELCSSPAEGAQDSTSLLIEELKNENILPCMSQ